MDGFNKYSELHRGGALREVAAPRSAKELARLEEGAEARQKERLLERTRDAWQLLHEPLRLGWRTTKVRTLVPTADPSCRRVSRAHRRPIPQVFASTLSSGRRRLIVGAHRRTPTSSRSRSARDEQLATLIRLTIAGAASRRDHSRRPPWIQRTPNGWHGFARSPASHFGELRSSC